MENQDVDDHGVASFRALALSQYEQREEEWNFEREKLIHRIKDLKDLNEDLLKARVADSQHFDRFRQNLAEILSMDEDTDFADLVQEVRDQDKDHEVVLDLVATLLDALKQGSASSKQLVAASRRMLKVCEAVKAWVGYDTHRKQFIGPDVLLRQAWKTYEQEVLESYEGLGDR